MTDVLLLGPEARTPGTPRRDRARLLVTVTGEVLITLGVVVLLFVVHVLYGTGLRTEREQRTLGQALERTWSAVAPVDPTLGYPDVPLGAGLAKIYLPRLGRDYVKVVVQGSGVEDLKKGPGHYPSTALPGEVGNVGIAGHRTTYGAPFHDVDALRPGDAVVLETRDSWFTYRVLGSEVVRPSRSDVLLPVPGRPGERATRRLLTLTTCHPRYSARQRLVVRAELAERLPKTAGRPGALAEAPVAG